jgi:serine O-acetyltransferase
LNCDFSESIRRTAEELADINRSIPRAAVDRPGMKRQVVELIGLLRSALYPEIFSPEGCSGNTLSDCIGAHLQGAARLLRELVRDVLPPERADETDGLVCAYVDGLAAVAGLLKTDIRAAYEGDPAAVSEKEIMLAYPTFEAVSIYRLAHRLYELKVPLLPRMMTEHAHQLTGIDIHPGASIGPWFFIDHGTGVVIGETCTIGEHVKLYQGVTLGARSFQLDENGNPVKGIKRHPDIGNRVVIYAGATILGGGTVIGDDCVIGGNVWLTSSVPAGSFVTYGGGNTQVRTRG